MKRTMTFPTGSKRRAVQCTSSQVGAANQAGFSLIEMLTVLAILTFLIGLVAVAVGGLQDRAKTKNAEAQIDRIRLHLEEFQKIAHSLPSDGIDSPVVTEAGTELQSGAALTFALARPTPRYNVTPGGKRELIGRGDPVGEFSKSELYVDPDDEDAVELLDPWLNAFHYDRLKGRDSYSEQNSGDVHLSFRSDLDEHGEDPRQFESAVASLGPQNPQGFDVWSHGPKGHSAEEAPEDCIPSWQKPTGGGGGE